MFKIVHAANLQMWKILNVIKNSLANWKMDFTLQAARKEMGGDSLKNFASQF